MKGRGAATEFGAPGVQSGVAALAAQFAMRLLSWLPSMSCRDGPVPSAGESMVSVMEAGDEFVSGQTRRRGQK